MNCLIAQSGGPTAVINASLAGIIKGNQLCNYYEHVYGGLYGIEGILEDKIYDVTNLTSKEIDLLIQTPSSALGSCRYKLNRNDDTDFKKLIQIMDIHAIDILFYIGGNDSMDTIDALSKWAKENNVKKRFVGIPKTVDNDLCVTDHCPGFGSAAKYTNMVVNSTWHDYNVYTRKEAFIVEIMGRDAGWLVGSSVLSNKVDLVIVPEVGLDIDVFINEVKKCMDTKNKCYIAISEGAKFMDGSYVSSGKSNDNFGHASLGGSAEVLKNILLDSKVVNKVKLQIIGMATRSASFAASKIDREEAYNLGLSAFMKSMDPNFNGEVVYLEREDKEIYNVLYKSAPASEFANLVKTVPMEWILPNYKGFTKEFYEYVKPLMEGEVDLIIKDGLPATITPFNLR